MQDRVIAEFMQKLAISGFEDARNTTDFYDVARHMQEQYRQEYDTSAIRNVLMFH